MTTPSTPAASGSSPAPAPASAHAPAAAPPRQPRELTLISHSMLFYWWPIWLLGFAMALVTYVEKDRLAILPDGATITESRKDDKGNTYYEIGVPPNSKTKSLHTAVDRSKPVPGGAAVNPFPTRVSEMAWMGPLFCVVLLLTVVITNVPLRGLWSFLVLLMMLVLALLITLVPRGWEQLLTALGDLHIYINMAGYLFIATVVFVLWAVSVFIFDQRTYMVVKPGQIQVCEHVGASIRTFDTVGMTFEKQRDDLFRHWLLGFFSGDLIVRTAGAERETIRLPNVLWIGWRLEELQKLLAEKATVSTG
jgi:hypothetical protein